MIVKKRLDTYADVEEQVSLKTRTTFRIGGNCRYFIYPKNEICFLRILQILKEENISWKIFGKGSNILWNYPCYFPNITKYNMVFADCFYQCRV